MFGAADATKDVYINSLQTLYKIEVEEYLGKGPPMAKDEINSALNTESFEVVKPFVII